MMDNRKYQLFKTEMCRNWQEMGECRYSKKCRFAHGIDELRGIQRHARYKTEICKTFHLTGTCLYGVRCTFVHDEVHVPTIGSPKMMKTALPVFSEEDLAWSFFPNTSTIWSDRRYSSSSSSSSSSVPFI
ncbi:CCCH-type zinc finger protein [Mucor mucedo]|uniref:C3H1-type domain-containing protein n=1 Tax=Mucor saturninus TaxID=64648 RepID=A0A8H7UZ67_9FUNG|nr:CCCH-type zinc finger protein [Mucor mucedo]KAG2204141.1 hypothetical protein INT47_011624 [Mucor saturninus]KAI7879541.1 CCCH-type zinc finger protein [Mucor mucedo]